MNDTPQDAAVVAIAHAVADALAADRRTDTTELKRALVAAEAETLAMFEEFFFQVAPTNHQGSLRWQPVAPEEVERALQAWLEGDDGAFAALVDRSDPRKVAKQVADSSRRLLRGRRALRKRLTTAEGWFAGVLAETMRVDGLARTRFQLARWAYGAQDELRYAPLRLDPPAVAPRDARGVAAITACRLVTLERSDEPLSVLDPLAIAERVVLETYPEPVALPTPLVVGFRRALATTVERAGEWRDRAGRTALEPSVTAPKLAQRLCATLDQHGLAANEREELLRLEPPPEPLLDGEARALVRLGIGDRAPLVALLGSATVPPWALALAIDAAGLGSEARGWLVARLDTELGEDLHGSMALLRSAGLLAPGPDAAHAVTEIAGRVPEWLTTVDDLFQEGLYSVTEIEAAHREASLLAEALGKTHSEQARAIRDALATAAH